MCVVWEGMREQLGVDWSVSVQCGECVCVCSVGV